MKRENLIMLYDIVAELNDNGISADISVHGNNLISILVSSENNGISLSKHFRCDLDDYYANHKIESIRTLSCKQVYQELYNLLYNRVQTKPSFNIKKLLGL